MVIDGNNNSFNTTNPSQNFSAGVILNQVLSNPVNRPKLESVVPGSNNTNHHHHHQNHHQHHNNGIIIHKMVGKNNENQTFLEVPLEEEETAEAMMRFMLSVSMTHSIKNLVSVEFQ
jgi:hypothetical protein